MSGNVSRHPPISAAAPAQAHSINSARYINNEPLRIVGEYGKPFATLAIANPIAVLEDPLQTAVHGPGSFEQGNGRQPLQYLEDVFRGYIAERRALKRWSLTP